MDINIEKVIKKGTIKQKLDLYANNLGAQSLFKKGFLTDKQTQELEGYFYSDYSVKKLKRIFELNLLTITATNHLQGAQLEVRYYYNEIKSYILLWNVFENAELMTNLVLYEIKDIAERKRIAEELSNDRGINLIFAIVSVDDEGYININPDFSEKDKTKYGPSSQLIESIKEKTQAVEKSIARYYSWRDALFDFMNEKKYKPQVYVDFVNALTKAVETPIVGSPKYNRVKIPDLYHPRLEKAINKFSESLQIKKLKRNKEEYNWFKNKVLGG